MKISAALITFNEAHHIERCLQQLQWCDEIIVIDSGSTDNTVEICKKNNANVVYNSFEHGFGPQKNLAISHCKNDWILSIDADEVLSDQLVEEIKNLKEGQFQSYQAFSLIRTHVFLGRVFTYGKHSKERITRLFHKNHGKFNDVKIHESLQINGKIGTLKNNMLHYTIDSVSQSLGKMEKYADMKGDEYFQKNKKSNLFKLLFKFPTLFFKEYILHLNFLNGFEGFVWSLFLVEGAVLKYIFLHEKIKKSEKI